jgi:hypothetical protein
MNNQKPFHRAAGTFLFAAAMVLGSSSATATCSIQTAAPASTVTPDSAGTYDYGYAVQAVTGSCVDIHGSASYVIDAFEVPYFTDAGITNIVAPSGWTAAVVDTDTFNLGSGAETLVWTAATGFGIQPDSVFASPSAPLAGFGYTALYGSAYAPAGLVLGSFQDLDIVDPALPASPSALTAGLQLASFPSLSAVPEPSTLLAMLAGLGCLAVARRRRV